MIHKIVAPPPVMSRDDLDERQKQFDAILELTPKDWDNAIEFTTENISAWRSAFNKIKPKGSRFTIRKQSDNVYRVWRIK